MIENGQEMIDWLRNAGSDEWNGQMLNRVADEIDGLNNTIAALREALKAIVYGRDAEDFFIGSSGMVEIARAALKSPAA